MADGSRGGAAGPGTADADWRAGPAIAASERLTRAAAWWAELSGPDGAAVAETVAKAALPADLRPSVLLVDLIDDASDVLVRLAGDRVQRHSQPRLVGRRGTELFGSVGESQTMTDMLTAAAVRRPVSGSPDDVGPDRSIGSAAHLVLPLREARGRRITGLLIVVDFLARPMPASGAGGGPIDGTTAATRPTAVAPIAATLVLLAVFVVAGLWIQDLMQSLERQRLERQGAHVEDALNASLDDIVNTIDDLAAIVAHGGVARPAEFARLADTFLADHPARAAIRAAVLAPEWQIRDSRGFSTLTWAGIGTPVPPWPPAADGRSFPALLVWPDPADSRILGYDLWTDPARRAAARISLETGRPHASAPVVLTQDAATSQAVPVSTLLVQAVASPVAIDVGSMTARADRALVALGITLDDLVTEGLGDRTDGLHLAIYDAGPVDGAPRTGADRTVLFAKPLDFALSDPEETRRQRYDPLAYRAQLWHRQIYTGSIEFAGRRIGIQAEAAGIVDRHLAEFVAGGLVALGLLLSAVTGLYLRRVVSSHDRLEAQVADRTREITNLNRELTVKAHHAMMADTAKSRLLATLSHELRTPLNGIIGFTDLLKLRFESLTADQQRQYLDTVAEAGSHMRSVIDRFLELSQGTPSAESLKIEPVALAGLDEWLTSMMTPIAARYEVDACFCLGRAGVPAIRADLVALRQALLNFVDNAIKFTPAGGRVAVSAENGAKGLILRVADTGVGMSSARLAALEEPLAEGGSRPVNGRPGLGLGLTLSRGLLALMGFESLLRSTVGGGTTVEIRVPASAVLAGDLCPFRAADRDRPATRTT